MVSAGDRLLRAVGQRLSPWTVASLGLWIERCVIQLASPNGV